MFDHYAYFIVPYGKKIDKLKILSLFVFPVIGKENVFQYKLERKRVKIFVIYQRMFILYKKKPVLYSNVSPA